MVREDWRCSPWSVCNLSNAPRIFVPDAANFDHGHLLSRSTQRVDIRGACVALGRRHADQQARVIASNGSPGLPNAAQRPGGTPTTCLPLTGEVPASTTCQN